jgi:two-component system sensor histidine kinase HydH
MRQVIASVDRLNRWIAGLMDAARAQEMPAEQGNVVPILHRIQESLIREIKDKDLAFELEAPTEGVVCAYNPGMLEQALIAMMVNAIEASPLGGRLWLRTERYVREEDRREMCRISVIDQGTGLPVDNPERIFEFSYSTKQRGMGLGLALTRQALQRQGGAAGAFNNPLGGATIYVKLPMEQRT